MIAAHEETPPTRRQRLYDLLDAAYEIRAWISLWDDRDGTLAADVGAWFDARYATSTEMTIDTNIGFGTRYGDVRSVRIRRGLEPFVEVYSLPDRTVTR